MNTHRTYRTASAVLATLAGFLLAAACSDDGTTSAGEPVSPSDTPSTAGSTTPTTTPSDSPSTSGSTTGYEVLGASTREGLAPGRWAISAQGSHDVPLAVLELPEGFHGGGGYIWTLGGTQEEDGWTLGYWTVDDVYVNPCTRAGGTFETESSSGLFVEALAAQRRTSTTGVYDVTIDGYDGVYVELSSPTGLDYTTCRGDGLSIFDTTTKGDSHLITDPGAVERYWVLDVDGERVVLTGTVSPDIPDAASDQLTEIVESIEFKRR